jgi:hypothetical protein
VTPATRRALLVVTAAILAGIAATLLTWTWLVVAPIYGSGE